MEDTEAFRTELRAAKQASIGQLLIRAGRLFNEAGLQQVRTDPRYAGARAAHLAVFPHLDFEGTRLVELARRMGITKQAVSQLIDDLERLQMVERRPDPEDRRAKRVFFTNHGRASLFEGLRSLRAVEDQVVANLSPARQQRLQEDLLKITAALEALLAS